MVSQVLCRTAIIITISSGSVLSSVTRSNTETHKARREARRIIHALHKAQDKLDQVEVCVLYPELARVVCNPFGAKPHTS